jgi:hypothetical protein
MPGLHSSRPGPWAISLVPSEYAFCSCARISDRILSHPLTASHPEAHISDQDVVRQAARAPKLLVTCYYLGAGDEFMEVSIFLSRLFE